MAEARLVTTAKRCYECRIGLAPEIRDRGLVVCGADTEIVLDNGHVVCITCAGQIKAPEPGPRGTG